jgi:hypothetical protein
MLKNVMAMSAWVALSLLCAENAKAQTKDEIRNQAKAQIAELKSQGEPKDRCSIGVAVGDGGIVTRMFQPSPLKPGDRFVSISGADVSGQRHLEIGKIVREVGPATIIPAVIERAGQQSQVELGCTNARPATEALLNGLTLVAGGKFDECVVAFGQQAAFGTYASYATAAKMQCALLSNKPSKHNLAQFRFEVLQTQVEEARWITSMRPDVIQRLRGNEGYVTNGLGASKFQELVAVTKSWVGGERMFEESAPDWALFRQSSEAALRQRMIDPDSARIEWPAGFTHGTWQPMFSKKLIEGYWTCGWINARNRMGGYTGRAAFVVVLDASGQIKFLEIGDAGKDNVINVDYLFRACSNSAKALPPPPNELTQTVSTETAQVPSIADEIKKLVDLRESGVITEEEFQAAKKRLLGTSGG